MPLHNKLIKPSTDEYLKMDFENTLALLWRQVTNKYLELSEMALKPLLVSTILCEIRFLL